jgi:hypothetical protein
LKTLLPRANQRPGDGTFSPQANDLSARPDWHHFAAQDRHKPYLIVIIKVFVIFEILTAEPVAGIQVLSLPCDRLF